MMQPDLDTFLILSSPELSAISSTIVREIIIGGGDTSKFLPKEVDISSKL
jgi:pantetheine-phosphate adenylyltransferase